MYKLEYFLQLNLLNKRRVPSRLRQLDQVQLPSKEELRVFQIHARQAHMRTPSENRSRDHRPEGCGASHLDRSM